MLSFSNIFNSKCNQPLALVLMLFALGCDERPCTPPLCDIREANCQREVMEATACLREVEPRSVQVDVVRLEDHVVERVDDADEGEEARFQTVQAGLALIGLEPSDDDLQSYLTESYENVGAFYSFEDDKVVVLHRGDPLESVAAVNLLVHEFSHVLQYAGREKRFQSAEPSLDAQLALAAIIEGDASWTADRALLLAAGQAPSHVDWTEVYAAGRLQSLADYVNDQRKVRNARSEFAYTYGASYVERVYDKGGVAAVEALLEAPPATTAAIMSGPGKTSSEREKRAFAMPVLPEFELIGSNVLGGFVVSGYLRSAVYGGDLQQTVPLPEQDSLSLWQHVENGALATVWHLRFATAEASSELKAIHDGLLEGPFASSRFAVVREENTLTLIATNDDVLFEQLSKSNLAFSDVVYSDLAELAQEF